MDLTKLNFKNLKRSENSRTNNSSDISNVYNTEYDYGTVDHNNGTEIIVQSILSNGKNIHTRVDHLLVYFEQTHFKTIDDDVFANLIRLVIFQHINDLKVKAELPSVKSIINFMSSHLN